MKPGINSLIKLEEDADSVYKQSSSSPDFIPAFIRSIDFKEGTIGLAVYRDWQFSTLPSIRHIRNCTWPEVIDMYSIETGRWISSSGSFSRPRAKYYKIPQKYLFQLMQLPPKTFQTFKDFVGEL